MEPRRPYLLVAMLAGLLATTTAARAASPVTIPISGTVDGSPERVAVSGLARITSTLVKSDAKFHHPPRVILDFDLRGVSGTGISTRTRYVTRGRDELLRLLVPSDVIEVTFPLQPHTRKGFTEARSALASFTLSFDVNTGALTGGTGTISAPGS